MGKLEVVVLLIILVIGGVAEGVIAFDLNRSQVFILFAASILHNQWLHGRRDGPNRGT